MLSRFCILFVTLLTGGQCNYPNDPNYPPYDPSKSPYENNIPPYPYESHGVQSIWPMPSGSQNYNYDYGDVLGDYASNHYNNAGMGNQPMVNPIVGYPVMDNQPTGNPSGGYPVIGNQPTGNPSEGYPVRGNQPTGNPSGGYPSIGNQPRSIPSVGYQGMGGIPPRMFRSGPPNIQASQGDDLDLGKINLNPGGSNLPGAPIRQPGLGMSMGPPDMMSNMRPAGNPIRPSGNPIRPPGNPIRPQGNPIRPPGNPIRPPFTMPSSLPTKGKPGKKNRSSLDDSENANESEHSEGEAQNGKSSRTKSSSKEGSSKEGSSKEGSSKGKGSSKEKKPGFLKRNFSFNKSSKSKEKDNTSDCEE